MSMRYDKSRNGTGGRWRLDWTVVEKGILVMVILLIAKQIEPTAATSKSCNTPTCAKEALQIMTRIDTKIDPCQDFHAFACNHLPNCNRKRGFTDPYACLLEERTQEYADVYGEPINSWDHHMVKVQKTLYDACLNESGMATYVLGTIKEVLQEVGGWPVVEGPDWDTSKFDWAQATSKLRQLGYTYSSFLEMKIVPDPRKNDKYIFQLQIPEVTDIDSSWFNTDDPRQFMAGVAETFGAEAQFALKEMSTTHQFLTEFQELRNSDTTDNQIININTAIEQLQKNGDTIDWVEFLTVLVGSNVTYSNNDFMLFPSAEYLEKWFRFKAIPKRIQANYMMWRVVENMLPFLTEKLLEKGIKPRFLLGKSELYQTRSQFCIEEIDERFNLNPLKITYLKRHLPENRRNAVKELVTTIKNELVQIVEEITWLDANDQQLIANKLRELNLVIGASGDYFDDKLFNNTFIDLKRINTDNFLHLLAHTNRHNQDWMFALINESTRDTKLFWEDVMDAFPVYEPKENKLYFPVLSVQDPIFNENRPNYVNYANMELAIQYAIVNAFFENYAWKPKTIKGVDKIKKCLIDGAHVSSDLDDLVNDLMMHILSTKATYAAYKNWASNETQETLISMDYTPNQLFWLASGYIFCPYALPYRVNNRVGASAKEFSSLVIKVINNNPHIATDFNCPAKYENNFVTTCELF